MAGLRAYAELGLGELRLTANQNLQLANIAASEKAPSGCAGGAVRAGHS